MVRRFDNASAFRCANAVAEAERTFAGQRKR
jgi:hypothetical protein